MELGMTHHHPTRGWLGAGASLTQHGVGCGYVVTQLGIECGRSLARHGVGRGYAMTQLRVECKKRHNPIWIMTFM